MKKLEKDVFDFPPLPLADWEVEADRAVRVERPGVDLRVPLRAGADRVVLARRFMRVLAVVRGMLRLRVVEVRVAFGRASEVSGGWVWASPGGMLRGASGVVALAAGVGAEGCLELGPGEEGSEDGVRLAMERGGEGWKRE